MRVHVLLGVTVSSESSAAAEGTPVRWTRVGFPHNFGGMAG
ncbi:hypothetical protein SAMN06296378_0910 [Salinibacterium xinjiangense]|uniref:Uncharacterized protein n=1 Tax=Salinibacterium xinjiangense TaxID=386302 RepID=A0A2C8Z672_9MICO|nr:hypothetical protein SAMN06296378_0910 [Salinibacterium xinjiangense]